MIGNAIDAERVFSETSLGAGWKKLGEGSFREAFLSPDGIVYKREIPCDETNCDSTFYGTDCDCDNGCNSLEFDKWLQFGKEAREGARLAECHLFDNGILAMEYIDGPDAFRTASSYHSVLYSKLCRLFNVMDANGWNNTIRDSEGIAVLVDYAM